MSEAAPALRRLRNSTVAVMSLFQGGAVHNTCREAMCGQFADRPGNDVFGAPEAMLDSA